MSLGPDRSQPQNFSAFSNCPWKFLFLLFFFPKYFPNLTCHALIFFTLFYFFLNFNFLIYNLSVSLFLLPFSFCCLYCAVLFHFSIRGALIFSENSNFPRKLAFSVFKSRISKSGCLKIQGIIHCSQFLCVWN